MRIRPKGLPQPYFQVLLIFVGSAHEEIQEALLDIVLFPNSGSLESNTLLRFGRTRIPSGVKDCAVLMIANILCKLDDRLSQVRLNPSPANGLPRVQGRMADSNSEEDWFRSNPVQIGV